MSEPSYIILYVADPLASAAFYADLLGLSPVESSPAFALFVLHSGIKLGLWAKHTVAPAPSAEGGGAEIAWMVADKTSLNATYTAWRQRGLNMIQAPVEMDFGFTFTAADPDGHRLRVFSPNAA